MKITNLSFEFLIEHGLKYKLATRKLNYFRLDTRNLDRYSIANGIRYISNSGTNKELVMIGTERNNETTIKGIYNLRKLTYFIYKRECLIGILESFTYCVSENRFDIIHFFVKKMDCEEISLTLEFLLPLNLDSQILGMIFFNIFHLNLALGFREITLNLIGLKKSEVRTNLSRNIKPARGCGFPKNS